MLSSTLRFTSSFWIFIILFFFFFNDTPTTEIYTLSLHDALPIDVALAETGQHLGCCLIGHSVGSGVAQWSHAGEVRHGVVHFISRDRRAVQVHQAAHLYQRINCDVGAERSLHRVRAAPS